MPGAGQQFVNNSNHCNAPWTTQLAGPLVHTTLPLEPCHSQKNRPPSTFFSRSWLAFLYTCRNGRASESPLPLYRCPIPQDSMQDRMDDLPEQSVAARAAVF
jgi:hypothetical protein